MKKAVVVSSIALCVGITGLIWNYYSAPAQYREEVYTQNQALLTEIMRLNAESKRKADSLKRFNPDPLLIVFETIERSDRLSSSLSYAKKLLTESVYHDLLLAPDESLRYVPEEEEVFALFQTGKTPDYSQETLKKEVSRYIIFHDTFTKLNTAQLKEAFSKLLDDEICRNNEPYECYARIILQLNELTLEIERLKAEIIRR